MRRRRFLAWWDRRRWWMTAASFSMCVLWLASGHYGAHATCKTSSGTWHALALEHGALNYEYLDASIVLHDPPRRVRGPVGVSSWLERKASFSPGELIAYWRPYHVASGSWPRSSRYHEVHIPLWQPTLLLLALAAFSHGLHLGAWRVDPARCSACGYDLKGVSAERCPECGEPRHCQRGTNGQEVERSRESRSSGRADKASSP